MEGTPERHPNDTIKEPQVIKGGPRVGEKKKGGGTL